MRNTRDQRADHKVTGGVRSWMGQRRTEALAGIAGTGLADSDDRRIELDVRADWEKEEVDTEIGTTEAIGNFAAIRDSEAS